MRSPRFGIHGSAFGMLACSAIQLAAAESLLLTGATVHTVSGPTLTNAQVLIENGKIAAVVQTIAAAGVPTVDMKGLHLYPGLIALDTPLGLVEIEAVRATLDVREVGDYTPDVQSWVSVTPDSELIPVARANGITHFEPTPEGGIVAGYSGLLSVTGWTSEEMAVQKPIALHVYWPEMDLDTTPKDQARDKSKWKSLDEQAKERRAKLKALDDFFAEARAYAKARAVTNAGTSLPPNPPWEAMLPVVRGEVPITIHADEVRQIRAAVTWAETNHFRMILAGGRDAWRVAALLATNQIPVVYAHTYTLPPRDTDPYDVQFKAPSILQKAGVTVAFSISGADPASLTKNIPYDAAQAVAFGLPHDEALKGITLYPARLAGVADRLGSIEVGKEATLFAADGDILDIRTNVKRLWIAGKEQPLDSRHTRLYEKYRNRPK